MRAEGQATGRWAPERRGGGKLISFDRLRGNDVEASRLVALVAADRHVPTLLLLHPSRCSADVAEARQLAMYLMHVVLGRSYAKIGRFFGRDRTTVSHACARIEDRRDAAAFEARVARLEARIVGIGEAVGQGRRHAAG